MKVLILGAKGMLGQDLAQVFADKKPILWDKKELDITKEQEVKKSIFSLKPQLIINAAAYTDVEKAETNPGLAKKINGLAVQYLAETARATKATFIHFSTDYIFEGTKKEGYKEDDLPKNPPNTYGQSKLLGEKLLLASGAKYYLIRTSWLFGPKKKKPKYKNFVQTILDLGQQRRVLKVVNDQFGKPTFTWDLAQATRKIWQDHLPFGIYHRTNEPETTWYHFARQITNIASELGVLKQKPKITPVISAEFPTKAKRPQYSILVNTKLPPMRLYKKALKEYLQSFIG